MTLFVEAQTHVPDLILDEMILNVQNEEMRLTWGGFVVRRKFGGFGAEFSSLKLNDVPVDGKLELLKTADIVSVRVRSFNHPDMPVDLDIDILEFADEDGSTMILTPKIGTVAVV